MTPSTAAAGSPPSSNASEPSEAIHDDPPSSDADSDHLDDVRSRASRKDAPSQRRRTAQKRHARSTDDEDEVSQCRHVSKRGRRICKDALVLEEGQSLAGQIQPAPRKGQVPPGCISQNTFAFLANLQVAERNDREWFRLHEPAFRQAEMEWKAFVQIAQLRLHQADDEVPVLPSKDVIHRIYRDIRFSSDKTPYKQSFSFSTSRGGRKGIWAGYYVAICPNNKSIIAGGLWSPQKSELAMIRQNIIRDPARLRREISRPEFVKLFGAPRPHPQGKRQNVFGHDDALKVAPKGISKDHQNIDMLKLRSIAVSRTLSDDTVLQKGFMDVIQSTVEVMTPFVHLLNDFITIPS